MQDDEEFLREPTNQELIKELNIAKLDILEWRNKLEIAMTRLAAVTAQRDELLELLKSSLSELKIFVFNSEWQKSDFPVIALAEAAIAKCEVQNG